MFIDLQWRSRLRPWVESLVTVPRWARRKLILWCTLRTLQMLLRTNLLRYSFWTCPLRVWCLPLCSAGWLVDKLGSDNIEHLSSYRRKCNSDECQEDEDLLIHCVPDKWRKFFPVKCELLTKRENKQTY